MNTAFENICATFATFADAPGLAYRDDFEDIRFQDLHHRALCLASRLREDVPAGARVAIFGHKSATYLVAYWACALTGHPVVPIELDMPIARQQQIVENLNISMAIDARRPLENQRFGDPSILCDVSETKHAPADLADLSPVDGEQIFYILNSSGSTGAPKAICVTWDNVWDFVKWTDMLLPEAQKKYAITGNVRYCFDVSLFEMWTSWRNLRPIISYSQAGMLNTRKLVEMFAQNTIGIWVGTPSIARIMCLDRTFCAIKLPTLQTFLFCGEQLDKSLVQDLWTRFGSSIRIVNTYGPTEATVAVTSVDIAACHVTDGLPLPIGVPREGTSLFGIPFAEDSENMELVIAGRSVTAGYADPRQDKKAAFRTPGEYRTGDLVTQHANSNWYYQGRTDTECKINGHRIDLRTLEDYVRSMSGVSEVKFERHASKRGRVWLEAHVVIANTDATLSCFVEQLDAYFPPYFIPRVWHGYRELIVNLNSKIDWAKIKALPENEKEKLIWTSAHS